jgi:hypothetical protein
MRFALLAIRQSAVLDEQFFERVYPNRDVCRNVAVVCVFDEADVKGLASEICPSRKRLFLPAPLEAVDCQVRSEFEQKPFLQIPC